MVIHTIGHSDRTRPRRRQRLLAQPELPQLRGLADYLVSRGRTVLHILGPDRIERALLPESALPQRNGMIFYP